MVVLKSSVKQIVPFQMLSLVLKRASQLSVQCLLYNILYKCI